MSFEVYHPRSRGEIKPQKMVVSLSKNSVVLNKPAREKLQQPEYVELAYDNDSGTIRIRPATNGEGVQMKKSKIFAKGFYNQFNLSTYGKYFADYKDEENAIFVTL